MTSLSVQKQSQGQQDLPTLCRTMTIATNISLLCLTMILNNEPPNSTSNIARASSVVINSASMAKLEGLTANLDARPMLKSKISKLGLPCWRLPQGTTEDH